MIRSVANKIAEVKDGQINVYNGDYDYYLYKTEAQSEMTGEQVSNAKAEVAEEKFVEVNKKAQCGAPKTKEQKRAEAEARNRLSTATKGLKKEIAEIEAEIEADSKRIEELLEIMSEPNFYMTAEDPTAIITEHAMLKEKLPELENEWLTKTEELSNLTSELIN